MGIDSSEETHIKSSSLGYVSSDVDDMVVSKAKNKEGDYI
jgi:hypothetical protein